MQVLKCLYGSNDYSENPHLSVASRQIYNAMLSQIKPSCLSDSVHRPLSYPDMALSVSVPANDMPPIEAHKRFPKHN